MPCLLQADDAARRYKTATARDIVVPNVLPFRSPPAYPSSSSPSTASPIYLSPPLPLPSHHEFYHEFYANSIQFSFTITMKFGKSLHNQIVETLPEWRDKFLSYKDLKKRLKLLSGASAGERRSKRQRVGEGQPAGFVALLEAELDKFNAFFLEKEEDYVIQQKELQDRAVRAAETGSAEELMRVRKEIVDLHGEMVLLENYSTLNYTGLVKILKKYDKRTGALIRLPFIQNVIQEPFFTTDLLYKLVKECEALLDQLLPRRQPPAPSEERREDSDGDGDDKPAKPGASLANGVGGALELEEIEVMESLYMKSTVAALRVLKEIRSGSSTVSAFSLPPLHGEGAVDQER